MHSKSLRSYDITANYDVDLGSEHRNVSTSLGIIRSTQPWTRRRTSFTGWKSTLDASRETHQYCETLDSLIMNSPPERLHDLGKIALKDAETGGSCLKGPNGVKRPTQSNLIRDLILQMHEYYDKNLRRSISNNIHKQSRKELRLWKTKWTERLLERFENTKFL